MTQFPMDQMPEVMRTSFLDKMVKGVQDAKAKFGIDGAVTVELVDEATDNIMDRVDA